jgi:hypothetical protein
MVTRSGNEGLESPLKERDVITHVGPHALDHSGNVRLGEDLQVGFAYFIPRLAHDGVVPLTINRAGETLHFDVPVPPQRKRVVPLLNGGYPAYFILGPMVFSTASAELASGIFADARWLPFLVGKKNPLTIRANDPPSFEGEELVIVPSPFFSHRLTKGYDSPATRIVEAVNDVRVKNLVHLIEMLRDSKDEFLEFKFAGRETETIVFRRQAMLDATEEILTDNGIRKQCSDGLEAIWKK